MAEYIRTNKIHRRTSVGKKSLKESNELQKKLLSRLACIMVLCMPLSSVTLKNLRVLVFESTDKKKKDCHVWVICWGIKRTSMRFYPYIVIRDETRHQHFESKNKQQSSFAKKIQSCQYDYRGCCHYPLHIAMQTLWRKKVKTPWNATTFCMITLIIILLNIWRRILLKKSWTSYIQLRFFPLWWLE